MDLHEWAHQYLLRNAKLKGWSVKEDGRGYAVEAKSSRRYDVVGTLAERSEADVVITLNTKENVRWAAEHIDELGDLRVVFTNPAEDGFWTLNVRMMRSFGDIDRFRKKPESLSSEVPLVK